MHEMQKEALMERDVAEEMKELRKTTGMNRREFCDYFQIPYATVTDWELGHRKMPEYVMRLMAYYIKAEGLAKAAEGEKEPEKVKTVRKPRGRKPKAAKEDVKKTKETKKKTARKKAVKKK